MLSWKAAFIITQLIEVSVGFLLRNTKIVTPRMDSTKAKRTVPFLLLIFAASTITHPILWFILYPWSMEAQLTYSMFIVFGEGYVWLVEGLLYKVGKLPFPFLLSLILNTSSYVFGNHLLPLFI
jgi:hypothetical protein